MPFYNQIQYLDLVSWTRAYIGKAGSIYLKQMYVPVNLFRGLVGRSTADPEKKKLRRTWIEIDAEHCVGSFIEKGVGFAW